MTAGDLPGKTKRKAEPAVEPSVGEGEPQVPGAKRLKAADGAATAGASESGAEPPDVAGSGGAAAEAGGLKTELCDAVVVHGEVGAGTPEAKGGIADGVEEKEGAAEAHQPNAEPSVGGSRCYVVGVPRCTFFLLSNIATIIGRHSQKFMIYNQLLLQSRIGCLPLLHRNKL